jgi:hypothetical protein
VPDCTNKVLAGVETVFPGDLLQDVIDLRNSNWQARRREEGPKTIKEIHDAAAEESLRAAARPGLPDRRDRDSRRGFPEPRPPP